MFLAPYEGDYVVAGSPSWLLCAKKAIHTYVANNLPTAQALDNNVLYIGETARALNVNLEKNYSILLFTTNPFNQLAETTIQQADVLYTINADHKFLIKNLLEERFGGNAKKPEIIKWVEYPKPFEPVIRQRKLLGIVEPDFDQYSIFENLFKASNSITSTFLSAFGFDSLSAIDLAFYCTNEDTYNRLSSRTSKNIVPIYYLDGDPSPTTSLTVMPNAVMSLDLYRYNPVLSGWGQRIPVSRPNGFEASIPNLAYDLSNPTKRDMKGASFILNFVNKLKRIEEYTSNGDLTSRLNRRELLGDLYGDYIAS